MESKILAYSMFNILFTSIFVHVFELFNFKVRALFYWQPVQASDFLLELSSLNTASIDSYLNQMLPFTCARQLQWCFYFFTGGVFIVIFIGVVLAVITLGIEYLFYKRKKQRNNRVVTVEKYPPDNHRRQWYFMITIMT